MKNIYKILLFLSIHCCFASVYAGDNPVLLPSAAISGTTSVCQGSTAPQITFTGSGGTAPYTFVYKINGGGNLAIATTGGSDSVTVNAPTGTAGVFNYTLVNVHDAVTTTPQPQAGSATITIWATPAITGSLNGCLGLATQLTSPNAPAAANAWVSSNSAVATIGANGLVSSESIGTTNITYTDINNCQRTVVFTVGAPPVVDFTFNNNNACSGTNIQYTSSVTGGMGPYTYAWSFGGGGTASTANPIHQFNAVGCGTSNFVAILTVTDSRGCSASASHSISVLEKPDASLEDQNIFFPFSNCSNNPSVLNPDFTITVNNTSANTCATNYSINWGDGTIQNNLAFGDFPLSHTYTQLGRFDLAITAHGSNGCDNTVIYDVANQSNPAGSLGTLGSTTGLCAPDIVPFTIGNWEFNSPGTTYLLDFGDGTSVTLEHPLTETTIYHTYTTSSCPANSYTATLSVSNLCDTTPYTAGNIQVRIRPTAAFTLPAAGSCVGQSVCFTNTTVVGSFAGCSSLTSYSWNFGDPLSGASNVINASSSATPNACHTFSGPGVYTVTLTVTNPCGSTNVSHNICIDGPPAPVFTLSNNTGCAPLAVAATNTTNEATSCAITYAWTVTYAPSNCGTSSSFSFTGGTTALSASPAFLFNNPGTYTIRLAATNSCGTVTTTRVVTVKQPPTLTINDVPNACGATSVSISPTATIGNCGATPPTYLWSFPGADTTSSTDANPLNITYSTPGTYTITLEVTNECGMVSDTESFTIAPAVIAGAGTDVTICGGDSTTLSATGSGGSGTGYTYTWAPATGLSSAFIQSPVATPAATTTYTVTVRDSNNCTATDQVTVFVNVVNQGAIGNNQTICSGADPTAFTVTTPASGTDLTYQWEMSVLTATTGFTEIIGATAAIYDSPALTQHTWFRRKVTATVNGMSCTKTGNFVEVVINNVTPGAIAGDQTVCVGGDPDTIASDGPATVTGLMEYQWQSSTDNITFTDIPGTNNPSYNPPVVPVTTYYRRVVKSSFNSNLCQAISNVATITVVPDPVINIQPLVTQTICQNSTAAELAVDVTGGVGAYSYQWRFNSTNSNVAGSIIAGATASTFTPPSATVGTRYYYCDVSSAGLGCRVASATAQVIVTTPPTITTQPASSLLCVGGIPSLMSVAYANGTGTPSYQWCSNTINNNTTGSVIAGETNATYQPSSMAEGVVYYYCVITFSLGNCDPIASNTASVTANPLPTITTQPTADQSICAGGNIPALTVAYTGGAGTASYQWFSNTTAANTGGTLIGGAILAAYTPPVFTATGTYYYYAEVTLSGNGCGSVASNVAQVNVVNDPVISVQPIALQSLCQGSAPAVLEVTASGGVGMLSYQWYSNTTNSNSGGSLIPTETSSSFTSSTAVLGTQYYYCVITATGSGCSVTSAVAQVTVISAPIVTTHPVPQDICFGQTALQLSVNYANGTGTPAYQWFSNTVDNTATGSAIAGAQSATYQPEDDTAGTVYYYAVITFSSGGCTSVISNTAEVTITALPSVTTPQTAEACSGSAFTVTPANGGGNTVPAGTNYTWAMPTGTGFTGGSAQAIPQPSISQVLTNTTNAPVTAVYTVTPIINGCSGSTFTVIVTLNPKATIGNYTAASCSGGGFSVLPTHNAPTVIVPSGTIYSWDAPAVTGGLTGGVSATGQSDIGGTLINPTNVAQTATYTVTPVSPAGNCMGNPFAVTVTVNPVPFISTPQEVDICSGTAFIITPAEGGGNIIPAGMQYTWSAPVISPAGAITGGSAQAVGQSSISQTLTNTTNASATATYTVTPTAGTCGGSTFTVAVTVSPTPAVNTVAPQTLCNGENTTAIAFTGNVADAVYNWVNNTPSIGLAASGQGDIAGFAAINNGTAPVVATITVTPQVAGCTSASTTFTITVNPAPVVNFSQGNQVICSGTASAAVTLSSTTPGSTITWIAVQPAGITGVAASGTTAIPAQTLTNTTSSPITVTYTASAATAGVACPGPEAIYTITVNPVPFVNAPVALALCSGTPLNFIPADGGLNNMPVGTTFTWATPTGTGFTGGSAQATPQTSLNQTLVNTTNAPVTAVYTLSPVFNGCNGIQFTVTVTINPVAIIDGALATVCSGTAFSQNPAVNAISLPAGTLYSWSTPVVTGGITGGTAGTGQLLLTGTLVNPSATAQTAAYTVTPTSPAGNCTGNTFTVLVTVNPTFAVTSAVSDYNGFEISTAGAADGSINLTVTGGSGAYTYAWTGPGTFTASTQDLTGLKEGTYTVTINDGLCTETELVFVLVEPLPITIAEVLASHENVECFGQSTGVIEIEITQVSIAPFDYTIALADGTIIETVTNTTAESYVFDNLAAGTYNVTVTDANGTVKPLNGIIITQPASALAITNAVVTNFNGFEISCNGEDDASINITVAGGSPSYTYAWTGPGTFTASTQDILNLAPGTYTVIVNDQAGICPATQSFVIDEPQPLTFTDVVSDYNGFGVSCFGENDGSIAITPTGGTGTYVYQWSGPGTFTAATQNINNLVAGTYTLILSDNNGCALAAATYTLAQPTAITITQTHVNVLCFGAETGSIDVTVSGGSPIEIAPGVFGYDYSWSGPNGFNATTEDLTAIGAGTYVLTVTDNSGCTKNLNVTVTEQPEIIITPTTTFITCYGADDASISVAIAGGDAPYDVTWNTLATGTLQNNLGAGTYIITVTDDSGCTKSATIIIPEAPLFTVAPTFTHVTCFGAQDGSISLNLSGGTAPVNLTWSDGSTAGTTRNNLGPGTYTATILDGTPCEIVRTFTILQPQAIVLGSVLTQATDCDDAQSGAINLVPAGGTPPYTYAWSTGDTTEDLTGITAGNYSVIVTDANGCSNTAQFTLIRPAPMSVTVTNNVDFDCETAYVRQINTATGFGGVPPYNFTWSTGTVSGANHQTMFTNDNGTVIVTATDSMGCTAMATFEVETEFLGDPDFLIDSYADATYDLYSIHDPIQFTNTSTGDYTSVSWDFGDGSTSGEENPVHEYVREGTYIITQTVQYPYGCVRTNKLTILVEKGYEVMVPNGFTPNGDGINDNFCPQFKGLKTIELNVFDTWGSLIYSENGEVIKGWNGTLKNTPSENGNYYYKVVAETFYGVIVTFEAPFALIK